MSKKALKTYTNSWRGLCNPYMEQIMNEFKKECQPIIDKYINRFARENLEYCSINGALYEEFSSMLLSARLQVMLDLSKEDIDALEPEQ